MAPGPLTTAQRGGSFYAHRAINTARVHNRAFSAPSARTCAGQQQRFAVSTNANTGAHAIALDDHEAASVTFQSDGSCVIGISNKPGEANGGDTGSNGAAAAGNGAGATAQTESAPHTQRSFAAPRRKMSWQRDPASGGITFLPCPDELFEVDGDALQAVISAHPSPSMPNG
jgi:hypothetical protein